MDYRILNTTTYNLLNEGAKTDQYLFVDRIPRELYHMVLKWSNKKLNFNDIQITLSTGNGNELINIINNKPTEYKGVGMLEIELRGALIELDINGHKSITLSKEFMPVLHYTDGKHAMCMVLSLNTKQDKSMYTTFTHRIMYELNNTFDEVILNESPSIGIDMVMTTIATTYKELLAFNDVDTINIITTPFTLE